MLHKVSSYDMFIYAYDGRSLVGPETLTITVNGRIVFHTAAAPTYFPSYIYTKNILSYVFTPKILKPVKYQFI